VETAVSLATYEDGSGTALAENLVGNGRVLTFGFYPTPQQARTLLTHLADQLAIETLPDLPAGVVTFRRDDVRLLLNFSERPQTVTLGSINYTVAARDLIFLSQKSQR
jgi:beta-galactosidase GanA